MVGGVGGVDDVGGGGVVGRGRGHAGLCPEVCPEWSRGSRSGSFGGGGVV